MTRNKDVILIKIPVPTMGKSHLKKRQELFKIRENPTEWHEGHYLGLSEVEMCLTV